MSETNDDNAHHESGSAGPEPTPDPFAGPGWSGDRPFPSTGSTGHRDGAVRVPRRKRIAGLPIGRKRGGLLKGNRQRSSRRDVVRLGSSLLGLLVLLSLAWLVFSALKARSELESVRDGVAKMRQQITAGDLSGARATAKSVKGHADDASLFTSGPVWSIGSSVPYLGDPLKTSRALTASVKLVADQALPPLIDASDDLRPSALRQSDGSFRLEPIQALGPVMRKAAATMRSALTVAQRASGSTWLSPVNHARTQLVDQLTPLTGTIDNIGRAARVLPPLLGADGAKNYMIGFENDAEIRGAGGVPGSFAIVNIDHGTVKFTSFKSDLYLTNPTVTAPELTNGQQFATLYPAAVGDYRDSDYSPHFPYTAKIWAAMWQAKTGQTIDGAMIIDPTALSFLLTVSGPVTVPNGPGKGTVVSASNVIRLTQQTLYTRYPDVVGPHAAREQNQRKNYLIGIAQAVAEKLLAPGIDTTGLVKQAAKAASQQRLLFYSSTKRVEDEIEDLPIGGTVPVTKHPYVAVALNNDGNSKLDYYLHASLNWQRTGCGDKRTVTVTLKLTNATPVGYVPPYAEDQITLPGGPKTSRFDIAIYGSAGGRFTSASGVTVGKYGPAVSSGHDRGHPVYIALQVDVARGQTKTLVFHEVEPAGEGSVVTRAQPMVNPMTVTSQDAHC